MANQQISQLDLVITLLENKYIDDSTILIEKGKSNGIAFEMKRKIYCRRDIHYLLFRYNTDKIELFPYFSKVSGLKKMCDYLLFVEEGQNLYICLIELKFGTESATNQLNASECFATFLLNTAQRIGITLTPNIYMRKIRISEERAKKRNRPTKNQDLTPDENGIINYDHSDIFRIETVLYIS